MKAKAVFLAVLVFSLTMTFPTIFADSQKPRIYVNPENNEFSTAVTNVGHEFTIAVMAGDWPEPGIFSYEFKLAYDNTMLEAVHAEIPTGHFLTPTTPGRIFIVEPGIINHAAGYVSFAATLLAPEAGKTGSGTIATITLKITVAPPDGQTISCPLEIKDLILVDPEANMIPVDQYDSVNGVYSFSSMVAPNTPPEASNLKITPAFPKTTDNLAGTYDYTDADSDPESESEIRWYKNGVLQEAHNDALTIPVDATSEGDEWYFTVRPKDGKDFGTLKTSPTVTIVAPPEIKEDLNGDGKVNIQDIAIWGLAFGSYPGHPRWDPWGPAADINENGKVDMIDAVLIAKAWTG